MCPHCQTVNHDIHHLFYCSAQPTPLTVEYLWRKPLDCAKFPNLDTSTERSSAIIRGTSLTSYARRNLYFLRDKENWPNHKENISSRTKCSRAFSVQYKTTFAQFLIFKIYGK